MIVLKILFALCLHLMHIPWEGEKAGAQQKEEKEEKLFCLRTFAEAAFNTLTPPST